MKSLRIHIIMAPNSWLYNVCEGTCSGVTTEVKGAPSEMQIQTYSHTCLVWKYLFRRCESALCVVLSAWVGKFNCTCGSISSSAVVLASYEYYHWSVKTLCRSLPSTQRIQTHTWRGPVQEKSNRKLQYFGFLKNPFVPRMISTWFSQLQATLWGAWRWEAFIGYFREAQLQHTSVGTYTNTYKRTPCLTPTLHSVSVS